MYAVVEALYAFAGQVYAVVGALYAFAGHIAAAGYVGAICVVAVYCGVDVVYAGIERALEEVWYAVFAGVICADITIAPKIENATRATNSEITTFFITHLLF